MAPIVDATTELASWSEAYVLSGATISCPSGATRDVFRITPRCLQDGNVTTTFCTKAPVNNGTAASFKIGSGFSIFPAGAESTLAVLDGVATSAAGFWVVR